MQFSLLALCFYILSFSFSAKAGPIPLESISNSLPSIVTKSASAVHRFKTPRGTLMGGGPQCSGTFISNDGYFLTALHCIKTASDLFSQTTLRIGNGIVLQVHLKSNEIQIPQPRFGFESQWPKLVMVGTGKQFMPVESSFLTTEDRALFQDVLEDFAILKFDVVQPMPCAKIAAIAPAENEELFGLGYPWFDFNEGSMANSRLHYTSGPFLKGYKYTYMAPFVEPDRPIVQKEKTLDYHGLYNPKRYGHALMAAEGGMSGGGIFNRDGNLVGLFESSVGPYSNFVLAVHVKERVIERLGAEASEKVFSCDQNHK